MSALEASVSSGKDDDRDGAAAAESRAQPPAQRILGRVFAECLRVLGNFITVMRLFSTVRPPQSAAILELRRRQGGKGTELQLRQDQVGVTCSLRNDGEPGRCHTIMGWPHLRSHCRLAETLAVVSYHTATHY